MRTGLALAALAAMTDAGAITVSPKLTDEALVNPGMGMVYYHYSNRLWAYGLETKPGDVLDWFPGTSVAYLRVLWNDVEPKEGVLKDGMAIYVMAETSTNYEKNKVEEWIKAWCPHYTFEEMEYM